METESCGNCKHAQLVWIHVGETHGGVHSSDTHIDMYICRYKRSQHYGHIMIGDHSCVGFDFKKMDVEKG